MEPRVLTGIRTRGGRHGYVLSYKVKYSNDGAKWSAILNPRGSYRKFPGNYDSNTIITNFFDLPIKARYLRVIPHKFKHQIQMRIEPIGCYEPYRKYFTGSEKIRM